MEFGKTSRSLNFSAERCQTENNNVLEDAYGKKADESELMGEHAP